MVRVFACCLLLLLAGCERDWKHIIVKKRVYLDGYYVHVPSRRETFPTDYPPPSQYPVNYPVASNSRTDSTVNRLPVQDTTVINYTPASDTFVVSNTPVQYQQPQQGGGGGTGYGGGIGGGPTGISNQPQQPDSVPAYAVIQPVDTLAPQTPPDTVYAVQPTPVKPKRAIPKENEMVVQLGALACQQQYGYPVKWNSFSAGAAVRCRVHRLKIKPSSWRMPAIVSINCTSRRNE